jgi:hypothetical protein
MLIEEVLERIDAQPIRGADELAQMSVSEIERQLANLGVDTDAELGALLAQVESPPMEPLVNLSVSDVEQLNIAQVERRLDAQGVDVRAWLSRAETLIRNAQVQAPVDESLASSVKAPLHGLRGGAHRPAWSRSSGRQRRRVPQALAASIVMGAIAGVTLSILDEPELDARAPRFSAKALAPAPARSESVAVREKSRKREGTQPAPTPENQRAKQSAFTRDLRTFGQPPGQPPGQSFAESRRNAMQDTLAASTDVPLLSAHEPSPALRMIPPTASTAPPAVTASVSANAVAQHAAKTPAETVSLASKTALRAPVSRQKSPENHRPTPSRVDDTVARVRSKPQASAPVSRAAAASRKEKTMANAVASIGAVRQPQVKAGTANESGEALSTLHALRAGQTLAVSLAGLHLREADRKALLRVFSDVDVSSGANLRLSIHDALVQTANIQLPQGRSITAVRDSRGKLVLEH